MKNQMQPIKGLKRQAGLPINHLIRTASPGSKRLKMYENRCI